MSQAITSPLTNQQQQQVKIHSSLILSDDSSFKSFHPSRVTTTVIPRNVCYTEYYQTVKRISTPSINTIENRRDQNVLDCKSKSPVTSHLISGWIIQESLEPFQQKEKKSSISIKKQKRKVFSDKSNVPQWNIDEVCSFFEYVLGKNCYASIIKEHLIDGAALLLLEDKHLIDIFKMQLELRLKLINRINELKNDDLSTL